MIPVNEDKQRNSKNNISYPRNDYSFIEKTNSQTLRETILRKNGVVYTPDKLAHYLAQKTVEYFFNDPWFQHLEKISMVDPASGDGVLLNSIANLVCEKKFAHITLCGVDIDNKAIQSSKKRFEGYDDRLKLVLINTNYLCPFNELKLLTGWTRIFESAGVNDGFDILIANPPWGANLSDYKKDIDLD